MSDYREDTITLRDSYAKNSPEYNAYQKELENLNKEAYNREHGGMGSAALGDFNTLLNRLEASKIRQQQAKDISARPNIYAGGLAQMMSNF